MKWWKANYAKDDKKTKKVTCPRCKNKFDVRVDGGGSKHQIRGDTLLLAIVLFLVALAVIMAIRSLADPGSVTAGVGSAAVWMLLRSWS